MTPPSGKPGELGNVRNLIAVREMSGPSEGNVGVKSFQEKLNFIFFGSTSVY